MAEVQPSREEILDKLAELAFDPKTPRGAAARALERLLDEQQRGNGRSR